MRETFLDIFLSKISAGHAAETNHHLSHIRLLQRALTQPVQLLLLEPSVLLLNIAVAFSFGLAHLLLTTFPAVFQQSYGFSPGIAGLSYLGMGVAMLAAVIIFSTTSDRLRQWHQAKGMNGPENRLALMAFFTPTIPVGFFWYGWAVDQLTPWIVPIIGTSFIGFGSMFVMVRDAWTVYTVSCRRVANCYPRCLYSSI